MENHVGKELKKHGVNDGPFTCGTRMDEKSLKGTYFKGKKHGLIIAWYPNGSQWQHKFMKKEIQLGHGKLGIKMVILPQRFRTLEYNGLEWLI